MLPSPRNNYGFAAGIDGALAHRENSLDSIMSDGNGESKKTYAIGSDGKKMIPNPKFN